jgi:hypothetical protein
MLVCFIEGPLVALCLATPLALLMLLAYAAMSMERDAGTYPARIS